MGFSRSRQGPFAEQLPITAISGHYLIYPDGLPANNPHSPAGIPCLRWSPTPLIFLISNTQSGYLTANWREGMCSGKGKGRGKNLSRVFISPKKNITLKLIAKIGFLGAPSATRARGPLFADVIYYGAENDQKTF